MRALANLARVSGWRRMKASHRKTRLAQAMAQADRLRDAGEFTAAAEAYEEVTMKHPKAVGAWGQLGNMRKDTGAYAEAELAYLHVLHLRGDDADAHVQMGHLRKVQGRLSEARDWYMQAVELDPDPAITAEIKALDERDRSIRDYSGLGSASEAELDLQPTAVLIHGLVAEALKNRRA